MFTFQQDNSIYNTPPKLRIREYDEIFDSKIQSDCVSFGGNSGGKYIFQVDGFKDELFFNNKDNIKDKTNNKMNDLESKIHEEVDNKTKGIKSILGKLGSTIDRLKSEVGYILNPFSFMQSNIKQSSNLNTDKNNNENKENNSSVITTQVLVNQQQSKNNIMQLGQKLMIGRSCTKSCSKIKSQMKKYQNNTQFKSYQNMLKDITFHESNQQTKNNDDNNNNKQQQSQQKQQQQFNFNSLQLNSDDIKARRKLDFDFPIDDDESDQIITNPNSKISNCPLNNELDNDDENEFQENDDVNSSFDEIIESSNQIKKLLNNNNNKFNQDNNQNNNVNNNNINNDDENEEECEEPKLKKIFVKDINQGNNDFVNYYFIYPTQH